MYLIGRKIDPARSKKERKIYMAIWIVRIFLFSLLIAVCVGAWIDHKDRVSCAEALKIAGIENDRDACYDFVFKTKNQSCMNIQCDL